MSNAVGESMDWRFMAGHWSRAGGNLQSLAFYHAMLTRVAPFVRGAKVWHDYGCAEGDGTALIKALYPEARVKGLDLSPHAVKNALSRWQCVEFEVGDVTDPLEGAHVISSLHTLEHIEDPLEAIHRLKALAGVVIVVTPPVTPTEHGGHTGMDSDEYKKRVTDEFDVVHFEEYRTLRPFGWTSQAVNEGNILFVL